MRKTSRRRKTIVIMLIMLILMILELTANYPNSATPLERLELAASDTATKLRGGHPPHEDIVIVAIDDESLVWVEERWPWSRLRLAEIVNWLNDAGAKVIAFDIFLFDPSADPADDQALAQAFEEANAVVTVSQIFASPYATTTIDLPERVYLDVIDGYGLTEIDRDDDAIVRGVRAFKENNGEIIYNWAFEIAAAYLGVDSPTNPSEASLTFNGETIPLNQRGLLLLNFAGPKATYPTYPAAYVPLGDYPPETFKDKIVFIGASSETMQDLYPTPFSATDLTPGVEIVANTVDTLLTHSYFRLVPPWVTLLIIMGMALLARILVAARQPTSSNLLMVAGVTLYLILRQIIFYRTGIQLTIISPSLMLILG
ncbi:MAG TPA: CHASE2 domain-containing protein, partial [Anaerolineales bacterium]|nr:CHASE2 domain-containing protein [Anaerolineales bacterium]